MLQVSEYSLKIQNKLMNDSKEIVPANESYRKHKMRKLEDFESKTEHYHDFEEDLKEKINKLEDDLMTYEMSL